MNNYDIAQLDYEGDYRDDEDLTDMDPSSWLLDDFQVTTGRGVNDDA